MQRSSDAFALRESAAFDDGVHRMHRGDCYECMVQVRDWRDERMEFDMALDSLMVQQRPPSRHAHHQQLLRGEKWAARSARHHHR